MPSFKIIAGFLLTALMLTLIQQPFGLSAFAWIALVPMVIVSSPLAKKRYLILFGYLCCLGYWLGNLYWLSLPTLAGYIAFCVYIGSYWPLQSICIRWFRRKALPLTFMLPILLVGFESWQQLILTGFGWRLLGHSQYPNISVIQIADIFGVAGVSFLVAMVNGFVCDMMFSKKRCQNFKLAVVVILIAATLFYGNSKLAETDSVINKGPMIASVQTNVPLVYGRGSIGNPREIFFGMAESSFSAAQAKPVLVIWPETMILDTLEQEYILQAGSMSRCWDFDRVIKQLAIDSGAWFIVGATGGRIVVDEVKTSLVERTNSAYFYTPIGTQDARRYDKIHLIPFGEILPFQDSMPWFYEFLARFTPIPDKGFNLACGKDFVEFDVRHEGKAYNFDVIICYEDTDPKLTRRAVLDSKTGKKTDWLVNMSNEGWFTRLLDDGSTYVTTEIGQHVAISAFRAIENRSPIIRSVNGGVSCIIDSAGRLKNGYVAGDLPAKAMQRQGVSGFFADNVMLDSRITIFSRYGQWLDFLCGIAVLSILVLSFGDKRSKDFNSGKQV